MLLVFLLGPLESDVLWKSGHSITSCCNGRWVLFYSLRTLCNTLMYGTTIFHNFVTFDVSVRGMSYNNIRLASTISQCQSYCYEWFVNPFDKSWGVKSSCAKPVLDVAL